MQYTHMVRGRFLERPNRFVARVELDGQTHTVHVKNTGRCRELLTPGAQVWCQHFAGGHRKTAYDLIAVQKGERLINMDSQAPNKAALEWLRAGGLGEISALRPEVTVGDSRFDFYFERDGRPNYLEVKGCTLEHEGICAFPDAPTQRGVKHLRHLTRLATEGIGAWVLFVIQMADVRHITPNDATDPDFGTALRQAAEAGVQVLAVDCAVTPTQMTVKDPVAVRL